MLKVVCGIINCEGKIFIARRKGGVTREGKWEFPGGKIEEGEEPKVALLRELKEELGMNVLVQDFIGQHDFSYPDLEIRLLAFNCELISATYKLTDHDLFTWVIPSQFDQYDFSQADQPFFKLLKS